MMNLAVNRNLLNYFPFGMNTAKSDLQTQPLCTLYASRFLRAPCHDPHLGTMAFLVRP